MLNNKTKRLKTEKMKFENLKKKKKSEIRHLPTNHPASGNDKIFEASV